MSEAKVSSREEITSFNENPNALDENYLEDDDLDDDLDEEEDEDEEEKEEDEEEEEKKSEEDY